MRSLLKQLARGRMLLLVVGAIVLAVAFVGFGLMSGSSEKKHVKDGETNRRDFDVSLDDSRKVAGFVETYGQDIRDVRVDLRKREEELSLLRKRQEKQDAALREILSGLGELQKREETRILPRKQDGDGHAKRNGFGLGDVSIDKILPRIQKLTLALGKREADRREKGKMIRIPAGSFAEGTLLTGVYAPTQGSALPVQIRLDVAWIGPNRSRIPLRGAFLIGRAEGESNSRRVVIQVTKLSYVKEGGRTIEIPVNGYVVGKDGVLGVPGRFVWRMEETLGLATASGFISGASEALSEKETTNLLSPIGGATRIVTGDVLKFAGFRGGSRAGEAMEKLVVDRMSSIVPAVYVPNGQRVTVCLLEGATLEGLKLEEVRDETARNPYAGLDFDR